MVLIFKKSDAHILLNLILKYRLYNQGLVLLFPSHVSLHLSINKVKWLICKILDNICSKSKYLIIGLCL